MSWYLFFIARFTRARIETMMILFSEKLPAIARFTRARIETLDQCVEHGMIPIARFTRARIETTLPILCERDRNRPLHAGAD